MPGGGHDIRHNGSSGDSLPELLGDLECKLDAGGHGVRYIDALKLVLEDEQNRTQNLLVGSVFPTAGLPRHRRLALRDCAAPRPR